MKKSLPTTMEILDDDTPIGDFKYFSAWDKTASVRSKLSDYDCSILTKQSLKEKTWFFPASLSSLSHPALPKLSTALEQELLARNLILFLEYTTLLEHKIVNRSVEFIAHDLLPVPIPRLQRSNALKLYTDEGFHAVISANVAAQVADVYGLGSDQKRFSRIVRLEKLAAGFDKNFCSLGWFLIGFVSETVITKEFLRMGKSTIVKPVYNMLRDHLEDEWAHSRYFSAMFAYVWKRLSMNEKDFCAEQLPKIILECFRLEKDLFRKNLIEIGVSQEIATDISSDRNSDLANLERARSGWTATLYALQKTSFFSTTSYVDIFMRQGLIDRKSRLSL